MRRIFRVEGDYLQYLALAPYRMIGDRIEPIMPVFSRLEREISKADMKITLQAYASLTLFLSFTVGVTIFSITLILGIALGATLTSTIIAASTLGSAGGLAIFITLYFYPSLQAGTRRRILEEELPHVASHMAVLSTAGLPPERIFRSLAQIEMKGYRSVVAEESRNIVRDVGLLGYDVISAIERRIRDSPSRRFIDFLDGFVSVSRSGGDLTGYLLTSARGFMDSARIAARQLVETLTSIAEVYISLMVVFPLLVIIMLSVMGMIGGGVGGLSIIFLMQLVTYIAIPIFGVVLLLLLDSIMPPR